MSKVYPWNNERFIILSEDKESAIDFAVKHFIDTANKSIADHDAFYVALSGGSTPKAIFQRLALDSNRSQVNWNKVHIFWGDERNALPTDTESNYKMAMDAGISSLQIPDAQIHRMQAETNLEENAASYEKTILNTLGNKPFDLIMLGMGDDGHTASLFPNTKALQEEKRLVVANHVPQKNTHRMTFTFPFINSALQTVFYVLGTSKKEMVGTVFSLDAPSLEYPSSCVGTTINPSLWVLDADAAAMITPILQERYG